MPGRPAPSQWPRPARDWYSRDGEVHSASEFQSNTEPPKVFPKPDDFHAIGVRVMCNSHDLFKTRTLNDSRDAVQYLRALAALAPLVKEATDE